MTRKTADCYIAVFKLIEEKLFKMQPAEMMTDFEDGMRLAIKRVWPDIVLRGCWFHFCRSILRKSVKLGMKKLIKKNRRAKVVRKALMCIPLLPADKLQDGFDCILEYARSRNLIKRFHRLFSYVQSYWLDSQVSFESFQCIFKK